MALNIGEIFVRLNANTTGFSRNMTAAKSTLKGFANSASTMSTAATVALGGAAAGAVSLGAAAVKSSMTFNKAMANIGTLIPGNQKRLQELKKEIMAVSEEFGISTDIMAEGAYQTISAYGDSADTMNRVRLAAKFATAGVMSVATATDLLSAAALGYKDTGLEAMKKTADLAFISAKGKVTPEELARALPKVVPMAVELGVKQDELFAAMGTLSGVSGNANEVATQLTAVFKAFVSPTEDMKMVLSSLADQLITQGKISGPLVDRYKAITKQMDIMRDQYGKASQTDAPKFAKRLEELKKASLDAAGGLGKSVVTSLGLQGTLEALAKITGGNSSQMGELLSRVEGYTAAAQLAGEQSERYQTALKEMRIQGLTPMNDALLEQTNGINKTGQEWEKFKVRVSNSVVGLGDLLSPGLLKVIETVDKLIINLRLAWGVFNSGVPLATAAALAIVLAFKPMLDWFNGLGDSVGKALGAVWTGIKTSAEGAWTTVVAGFETFGKSVTDWFSGLWSKAGAGIGSLWDAIKASAANGWEAVRKGFSSLWTSVTTFFKNTWTYITSQMLTDLWNGIKASASNGWESVRSGFSSLWTSVTGWFSGLWTGAVSGMGSLWTGIKDAASNGWEAVRKGFSSLWTSITTFFQNTWNYIVNILNGDTGLWAGIKNAASNAWSTIWSGFNNLWTNISNWFSQLASSGYAWGVNLFQRFWEGMKSWLGVSSGSGSVNPALPFQGFATGGIVTSPTLAMVGEAGPEAIIPLNRMGGGGTMVNNFYISGSGNPDSVAEAIVQRLKLKGIRVV